MSRLKQVLDDVGRMVGAILSVIAALSLLFSAVSFLATRRPLRLEADAFPMRGARLASSLAAGFQEDLTAAVTSLDPKAGAALLAKWRRVHGTLQSDTTVLVLQVSNQSRTPLTNLAVRVEFISQFHDIAIDTNARSVLEALSKGPLATYEPARQQLDIQTFPRLPAKSRVTISIWGTFDLSPDLSVRVSTDELGTSRPALARRVTGIRATMLENFHWTIVALGLLVVYLSLAAIDRRRSKPLIESAG